jgi:hypothetical protein
MWMPTTGLRSFRSQMRASIPNLSGTIRNEINTTRFNHSNEHHVHIESDWDVCAMCGSLGECIHDDRGELGLGPEGGGTPSSGSNTTDIEAASRSAPGASACPEAAEQDTCDMVLNAAVRPGDEIMNTYDERGLSNAQLVVGYGFLLEGNEDDELGWEEEDLGCCYAERGNWRRLLTSLDQEMRRWAEGSEMVFAHGGEKEGAAALSMNADGEVSSALWLCVVVQCLGPAVDADAVRGVMATQICAEEGGAADSVLKNVAAEMQKLCEVRLGRTSAAVSGRIFGDGVVLTETAEGGGDGRREAKWIGSEAGDGRARYSVRLTSAVDRTRRGLAEDIGIPERSCFLVRFCAPGCWRGKESCGERKSYSSERGFCTYSTLAQSSIHLSPPSMPWTPTCASSAATAL